jgi:cytochrome c peroxidase
VRPPRTDRGGTGAILVALAALACSKADGSVDLRRSPPVSPPPPGPAAAPPRPLTPAARAGQRLFFDKTLSASGEMACATCHDPAHAYGPPNDRAVQLGGPQGRSPGLRATPSIRYKEFTPGYMDLLDNPDGVSQPAPGGGFAWDGRAFFHNGVMHSLEQAIRFYATRDARPELWYPTVGGRPKSKPDPDFPRYGLVTTQYVGGKVLKYDDLPAPYRKNIDTQLPLDGRAPGTQPPLTDRQVNDLVCFLRTLTDDYRPGTPPADGCAD